MKINWSVRFNNPHFWVQLVLAAVIPVLSYFGMSAEDFTSWPMLFDTLLRALTNPYVCMMAAVSLYNAVVDPTTKGIGDSLRALGYTAPEDAEKEEENGESVA